MNLLADDCVSSAVGIVNERQWFTWKNICESPALLLNCFVLMLEHFPSSIVSAVLFIDRTDRSASLSSAQFLQKLFRESRQTC